MSLSPAPSSRVARCAEELRGTTSMRSLSNIDISSQHVGLVMRTCSHVASLPCWKRSRGCISCVVPCGGVRIVSRQCARDARKRILRQYVRLLLAAPTCHSIAFHPCRGCCVPSCVWERAGTCRRIGNQGFRFIIRCKQTIHVCVVQLTQCVLIVLPQHAFQLEPALDGQRL